MADLALNLDADAVMDLAAEKVASRLLDERDLGGEIANILDAKVNAILSDEVQRGLRERIDAELTRACTDVLEQTFVPVSMWGEPTGQPTTIRDQLHQRALKFWEMRVEKNGNGVWREASYGGEPRYQAVYKQVATEAFEAAIKADVTAIVTAFREALAKDAGKLVAEHINALLPIKRAR